METSTASAAGTEGARDHASQARRSTRLRQAFSVHFSRHFTLDLALPHVICDRRRTEAATERSRISASRGSRTRAAASLLVAYAPRARVRVVHVTNVASGFVGYQRHRLQREPGDHLASGGRTSAGPRSYLWQPDWARSTSPTRGRIRPGCSIVWRSSGASRVHSRCSSASPPLTHPFTALRGGE